MQKYIYIKKVSQKFAVFVTLFCRFYDNLGSLAKSSFSLLILDFIFFIMSGIFKRTLNVGCSRKSLISASISACCFKRGASNLTTSSFVFAIKSFTSSSDLLLSDFSHSDITKKVYIDSANLSMSTVSSSVETRVLNSSADCTS